MWLDRQTDLPTDLSHTYLPTDISTCLPVRSPIHPPARSPPKLPTYLYPTELPSNLPSLFMVCYSFYFSRPLRYIITTLQFLNVSLFALHNYTLMIHIVQSYTIWLVNNIWHKIVHIWESLISIIEKSWQSSMVIWRKFWPLECSQVLSINCFRDLF